MTGIAGIQGPSEKEVTSRLNAMLGAMESRGSSIQTTSGKSRDRYVAIGLCAHIGEETLPLNPYSTSIVIDGRVPASLELGEISGESSQESLLEVVKEHNALSCITISDGGLLAARDTLGQKPLYYGSGSDGYVAFASIKASATKIGIHNMRPVPPGALISVSGQKTSLLVDGSLRRPREIRVSEFDASRRVRDLLIESLGDDVPNDLALAFSGGIDSSLVAKAGIENNLRPELITVGRKGEPELNHARDVAKILGLDITIRKLSESEVLESIPTVVDTVESFDPTIVGVSIPFFFACETARDMGLECLLAGQLSDELFAGYGRFDTFARNRDWQGAREEVWRSVLAASTNDFEPGDKLAVSHHLELRCPFAHFPLVEYGLQIPVSLKLRTVGDKVVRKYILRRVAADWTLPGPVVNRPKKAVQYSSGVQKILLREARRKRTSVGKFIESYCQN